MASTHQLRVQELFSIKGYVCVVTGGGTGIGLMATQALAANGMSCVLLFLTSLGLKGEWLPVWNFSFLFFCWY